EHSVLLETNVQFDDRNSVFGRVEWVQKSAEELIIAGADPAAHFDVSGIVLGYIRELVQYHGASVGLGVRGSLDFVPADLEPTYVTRSPAGVAVYLRLRPTLVADHQRDREQKMAPHDSMPGMHMPVNQTNRRPPDDASPGRAQ